MTENESIEVLSNFDMQVSAKSDGAYQSTIGEMACKVAVKALTEIQQYRAIGTVEECREARERQREKKPKHFYKKYGKHKWRRKENGEIDDFAWEFDYHNGVACEICGETVCVHCNPNYDELDDCEEEHWNCPNCGKRVGWKSKYCDCGQAIDWSDAD